MIVGPRLIARIALLSALIYVLSWGTSYLPNVNLAFLIAFAAGYLWGFWPGVAVGAIGMGLWTGFNPFGPAVLPVAVAQVIGLAGSGAAGALVGRRFFERTNPDITRSALVLSAMICTLIFYIPVTVADAWFFQPFWPRIIGGLPYVAISLGANALIFPLLFPSAVRINRRRKTDRL
jgi:hypothetical protein